MGHVLVLVFRVLAWAVLVFYAVLSLIGVFTIEDIDKRTLTVVEGLITGFVIWLVLWFIGNVIERHTLPR